MVEGADGDTGDEEAGNDEDAAAAGAVDTGTAGALGDAVPAALAGALTGDVDSDTAGPDVAAGASALTVVVDVLVTTACGDADRLHAASNASTPPRPTTASRVRRDKGRELIGSTFI